MKNHAIAALSVLLAAAGAALLLRALRGSGDAEKESEAPSSEDTENIIAVLLRGKYIDETEDRDEPVYCLVLSAPNGIQEVAVNKETYDACVIGEEVLCEETEDGLKVMV